MQQWPPHAHKAGSGAQEQRNASTPGGLPAALVCGRASARPGSGLHRCQRDRLEYENASRQSGAPPPAGTTQAPASNRVCAAPGCGATARLKRCKGCRAVRYCSMECLEAHWSEHRPECRRIRAQREAGGVLGLLLSQAWLPSSSLVWLTCCSSCDRSMAPRHPATRTGSPLASMSRQECLSR